MRLLLLSVISALAVVGSLVYMSGNTASADSVRAAYQHWKLDQGRLYASGTEDSYRFQVFAANLAHINAVNAQKKTYKLGLNKFSDLTSAEFAKQYLTMETPTTDNLRLWQPKSNLRYGSVDLREHSAVNEVRDQGHCGSCWAFATIASIEGAAVVQGKNTLHELSEQQLVDCSYRNHGCSGGLPIKAYQEMEEMQISLEKRSDYAYDGAQHSCHQVRSMGIQTINHGVRVGSTDSEMETAVSQLGPLTVGIYAQPIQHYTSGVFHDYCDGRMNHAVTIVGYGTDYTEGDYWIVRNSWGSKYGENGYVRMRRGANTCSIRTMVATAQI